jgi:hypothetical protein
MSFTYKQFGLGFDVAMPSPEALRFEELVELRGVDLVVVHQALTDRDEYGQPVYTETSFTVKAMVKIRSGELRLPPGEVRRAELEALLPVWAPVAEELYEMEVDGVRYHVTGVEASAAYRKVLGERVVP